MRTASLLLKGGRQAKKRKAEGSPQLNSPPGASTASPTSTPARPQPSSIKNVIPVILSDVDPKFSTKVQLMSELKQFHRLIKVSKVLEKRNNSFLIIRDTPQDVAILQSKNKMKACLGQNVKINLPKAYQNSQPKKSHVIKGVPAEVSEQEHGFLSDQISLTSGVPQGSVLSPLLFLIYVNDLPKPHHRQNSKSQFADDTALWAASRNIHIAAKLLQKDLRKLAKWCAKWRIKLNPEKTKVIIFSRSYLAGKPEPTLKLYGERLKIYPQVKFLGITFDSKFTFKKHFEDILDRCNHRYHRIRLLTNKK